MHWKALKCCAMCELVRTGIWDKVKKHVTCQHYLVSRLGRMSVKGTSATDRNPPGDEDWPWMFQPPVSSSGCGKFSTSLWGGTLWSSEHLVDWRHPRAFLMQWAEYSWKSRDALFILKAPVNVWGRKLKAVISKSHPLLLDSSFVANIFSYFSFKYSHSP